MSKAPQKSCPKCNNKIHVRRKQCDCGFVFVSKNKNRNKDKKKKTTNQKSIKTYTTPGRGKKRCQQCKTLVGVRTKICPICKSEIVSKKIIRENIKREIESLDWKTLSVNDIILSISGGPVFETEETSHNLGHYGKFKIKEIVNDGILCYGMEKLNHGVYYLYMGKPRISKYGTNLRPHKIRVLRKATNQ